MLPTELLRQVDRVHMRARRLVDGAFAGQHESIFKGRGIEFAEVREYAPGDDVRTIDWNVTARLGTPFVKQYVEERELTVMLLVDMSASGLFGSARKLKRDVIVELCAVLAIAAARNNDRVGFILFTDRIEKFIAPQKGKHRTHRVVHELLSFEPTGHGTDLTLVLDDLHKTSRYRTLCFVLSDFLAKGYEHALRVAHQRHDIVPVCVSDRHESTLPAVGLLNVLDLETGAQQLIDTDNEDVRAAHRQRHEQARAHRNAVFHALGLHPIEIMTDEPFINPLMRYFKR